jgi:hypothetical protein
MLHRSLASSLYNIAMRRVSFLESRTRKAPADGFTAAKQFAAPGEIPAMGVALRGMPFEFTDRE